MVTGPQHLSRSSAGSGPHTAAFVGPGPALVGRYRSEALWSQVPPDTIAAFRPHVARLAEQVLAEIQAAVPAYASSDDGSSDMIVPAVTSTCLRCIAVADAALGKLPVTDAADTAVRDLDWRAVFVDLGRTAQRSGRTLETMQAAFRIAGRVTWNFVANIYLSDGMSADNLCIAAEAVYATFDEITAWAVDGHVAAGAAPQRQRERNREQLLDLLIADEPPRLSDLREVAARADWRLPDRIVAVALEPLPDGVDPIVLLDAAVLKRLGGPQPCLITAEPSVHLTRLAERLRGRRAAIGPAVEPNLVQTSLQCARRALDLQAEGLLPDQQVIVCAENLLPMWLVSEPFLTSQIAAEVLSPLSVLTPPQQARLGGTLLEWLRHNGNGVDVAQALRVHPQTVRYRMNQLREMLGVRLDDPDSRFVMELVLRTIDLRSGRSIFDADTWPAPRDVR